ncbi:STAS domain-containing protein [Methanobrevibacter sp.]|uniref:STAS domain-containing protein n=1 Tax=Methanobrevibacter sp. TaxID=66852 RepID=UPI00388D4C93
MKIIKYYNNKELTLTIEGRVDTISSQDLEKQIDDEMGNFNYLIMDLTDLEYISSAGLRVLLATKKKLNPENIPFVIRNANESVNEIFAKSGFDKILKIE